MFSLFLNWMPNQRPQGVIGISRTFSVFLSRITHGHTSLCYPFLGLVPEPEGQVPQTRTHRPAEGDQPLQLLLGAPGWQQQQQQQREA